MRTDWQRMGNVMKAAENSTTNFDAKYRILDMGFHTGYAEPGYEGKLIATGNWNDVKGDTTISRLAKLLERMGFELEWSDEWTTCDECNLLVRTQPSGYEWQPSYVINDGGVVCHNCLDPAEHLTNLEGNEKKVNQIEDINPADYGYVKLEDYEHGWHPGQHDDPKRIAKWLREKGLSRFIFNMDSVGQFDQHFSAWVHESEYDLFTQD